MTIEWDAETYHRISGPQLGWGLKVLASIDLRGDEAVLDAGCGSGRLTDKLLERLPRGSVVAADRSSNMIAEATANLTKHGHRVRFWCGDLLEIPFEGAFDLVFSTATFHWILDHERLFRVLFASLRPGGRLVAQCGASGNLARLIERVGKVRTSARFAPHFRTFPRIWEFADEATTKARLEAAGFADIETNRASAPTPFDDRASFESFLERVVLRDELAHLPEAEARAFLDEVVSSCEGDSPPWVLDYRRLNLRGRRPA